MIPRVLAGLGAWLLLGGSGALADTLPDSAASGPTAPIAASVPADRAPGAAFSPALPAVGPVKGWHLLQASLAARGITMNAALTSLWIGDVAGGVKTGGTVQSLAYGACEADLEKATGWWRGGHAFANLAFIRGRDLSGRFVGDALVASNLEAYPSLRLYDAWIEQSFADGSASVRLGSMGADEEFSGTDGGAMLTNSVFGWEAGIGANIVNGGPIYFVPALGARLEFRPAANWTLRTGAYDGDSFDSPDGDPVTNAHGLRFSLDRSQGAFLLGEACHEWGAGGSGRPGGAKLGAWRHTADFPDQRLDSGGRPFVESGLDPATHHGNQGGYGVLEQKLWNASGDADAGIGAWLRLAGAPADRSPYAWVSEAGLRWRGVLPGRARDALGVGWANATASPVLRQQVRDANAADGGARPVPDHEWVIETAYQVNIGDHWVVTPDLQWIGHPGATSATANATVAGLRLTWQ